MKALILIADGFDDLQFFCPYYRLLEEGVAVTIASPRGDQAVGLRGFPIEADMPIAAVDPVGYDLLVIPGGQSPERLRVREEAIAIARASASVVHASCPLCPDWTDGCTSRGPYQIG